MLSKDSLLFYRRYLSKGVQTIFMHCDDAKLGNPLRPDKGRGFYAYRSTLRGLPGWFRASTIGWFPLLHVRCKDLEEGDLAVITSRALKPFFSEDSYNCKTAGIILGQGELTFHILSLIHI